MERFLKALYVATYVRGRCTNLDVKDEVLMRCGQMKRKRTITKIEEMHAISKRTDEEIIES